MARALFQIARGVDTGSLSNGELYYNQTTQSLQLGTNNNTIITLAKLNEINSGSLALSGDIDVQGNVHISGNLFFGNQISDTVTVVASLSSSLIPTTGSTFDLGSTDKKWANAYIDSINGNLSGLVNGINLTNLSSSVSQSIGNLNNTSASHQLRLDALEQHSSSVNAFTASITASYNATSQSLNNVSSSYSLTSQSLNNVSASLLLFSSSQYKTDSSSVNNRLDSIENYTSSLKSAIELTGSNVTIQGDFFVRGTTTTINSTIVNLSASFIEVDAGGAVNGGMYVIDRVGGGSGVTGSLLWDVNANVWKGGVKGSEIEFAHINDLSNLSASIAVTDSASNAARVNLSQSVYNTLFWPSTGLSASLTSGSQYQVNILSASLYDSIFAPTSNALSYSIHTTIFGLNSIDTGLSGSISSSISQLSSSVSQSIYNYSQSVYNTINFVSQSTSSSLSLVSSSLETSIITVSQSVYNLSSSLAGNSTLSASIYLTDATQSNNIIIVSASAWGAFQSASSYSASLETSILNLSASVAALSVAAGANTAADNNFTGNNTFTKYITGSISGAVDGIDVRALSASLNTRVIAATNEQYIAGFATTSSLNIVSASAWGAFQSASSYSSSAATALANYSSSLSSLNNTFATTGSNTFVGKQTINSDISASGNISASNLYITNAIYAYELHTIIESASVIFSSGSNNIGDQQNDVLTITGSLNQTGSTSFSELTGSLFAFSASLSSRFTTNNSNVSALSASIYQTDATQSYQITANAATASAYSASAATALNTLSSSIATTDATQTANITTAQNSANGAFASASAYSSSIANNTITFNGSSVKLGGSATIKATATNVLTIGTGLSGTSYDGSSAVTIANTGVTSITGTSNQVIASSGTGGVTLSLPQNIHNGATPTFAGLTINGAITATGDITAYYTSDERLKDNIQLISNPIQKVQQLRGVEFDWNDRVDAKAGQHEYGVIAQDVLKVMPELVKQRYDGYYGVDYDKIVGLLIEVVKDQEKRIKELENKLGS